MTICVSKDANQLLCTGEGKKIESLLLYGIKVFNSVKEIGEYDSPLYAVSWGWPVLSCKYGVMETGFFREATHIDTLGLYSFCSLNTPNAQRTIDHYSPPVSAVELLRQRTFSKHPQPDADLKWEGIVLALQLPRDKSIICTRPPNDYFQFVNQACKHYGKHLFLKKHPYATSLQNRIFEGYADQYGCQIGQVNHTIIDHCKFVITWSSTFAIDCMIKGIPVAQYAPGYFWQSKGLTFTNFALPDEVPDTTQEGYKLCEFLAWKYCFPFVHNPDTLHKILQHFSTSTDMFPLKEEWSYAANLDIIHRNA